MQFFSGPKINTPLGAMVLMTVMVVSVPQVAPGIPCPRGELLFMLTPSNTVVRYLLCMFCDRQPLGLFFQNKDAEEP